MAGIIDSAAQPSAPDDRRVYGTVVCEVLENCDQTSLGRVRIRLPWLPGYEPWARVAAAAAGKDRGAYWMPQKGDEVLVVFNHGDVREPYVIGSLWNAGARPPVSSPNDAENKWVLRTAQNHEIAFDNQAQSITIRSATGQRVVLEPGKVLVSIDENGSTSVELDKSGELKIKAQVSISIDAPTINIGAQATRINIG